MSSLEKYLKYKSKYLKLKKQIGNGRYLDFSLPDEVELNMLDNLSDEEKIYFVHQKIGYFDSRPQLVGKQTYIKLHNNYNIEELINPHHLIGIPLIHFFKISGTVNINSLDELELYKNLPNEQRRNIINVVIDPELNIDQFEEFVDSSSHIIKLTINYADQLNNNLNKLTNLNYLHIMSFNHPLGNSLERLINLKILRLNDFNHPLGNSLDKLTKLQNLMLAGFNNPLDNSLDNLTNLKSLDLMNFNHPLGNSLDNLANLEYLNLGIFNYPLDNSLEKLTNLQVLELIYFNHPLNNSLNTLTNLRILHLASFNHPFGDNLQNLINLNTLQLSNNYNYKGTLDQRLQGIVEYY